MRIKVCGLTNIEDALDAVALGADAIGFIFSRSTRQVDPETAKVIAAKLPPFVVRVGVFVDEDLDLVNTILKSSGMDVAQLHGQESPEYCKQVQRRVLKAFHLNSEEDIKKIEPYKDIVSAIVLDTYSEKAAGQGKTYDWGLTVRAKELGIPIVLSGGLNPENIGKAIKTVAPDMVDVNSGVEKSPGIKDYNKLQELISIIKGKK